MGRGRESKGRRVEGNTQSPKTNIEDQTEGQGRTLEETEKGRGYIEGPEYIDAMTTKGRGRRER